MSSGWLFPGGGAGGEAVGSDSGGGETSLWAGETRLLDHIPEEPWEKSTRLNINTTRTYASNTRRLIVGVISVRQSL